MRPGLSRLPAIAAVLLLPALEIRAESRFEKVLKLSPGGSFRLDTDMGSVTVTGTAAPDVRLIVTGRRDPQDLLRFQFDQAPGSVTVSARRKHRISWLGDGGRVHYEIQVPAETSLDIDTSGGGISIAATRSRAKLDTSGGGITVRDLVGDLEADTSGGSIDLADIRGRMRVETSGGGIEVAIDPEVGLEIDARGNDVKTEIPVRVVGEISRTSLRGSLGKGGAPLHLRTSGGGVTIRGL